MKKNLKRPIINGVKWVATMWSILFAAAVAVQAITGLISGEVDVVILFLLGVAIINSFMLFDYTFKKV